MIIYQISNFIFWVLHAGPSQGLKIRGLVILGGENVPLLVEIGLTDLPKTVGLKAPPAPPLATGLSP